jgi:hypothetical protein
MTTTTLWLDTEFNGFGGEFISAALVSAQGASWYQTVGCKKPIAWTAQHVMPQLSIRPVSLGVLQASLRAFLSQFERLTIVADWPADVAHFCDLLRIQPDCGQIMHTPPLVFELKPWLNGRCVSRIPHNALEDARALMLYELSIKASNTQST